MLRAIFTAASLTLLCTPAMGETSGLQALVDQFMHGWNSSDPKAISDLFAADADLIAPDGVVADGSPAIRAYYAEAFAHGYASSKAVGKIVRERTIGSDLMLLDASFSIDKAHSISSPKPEEKGAMVVVARRFGDIWRIIALRERSGSEYTLFSAIK